MDTLPFPRTARNCAMSAESEMFLGVYQKNFFTFKVLKVKFKELIDSNNLL
jgi:hypothetical protein